MSKFLIAFALSMNRFNLNDNLMFLWANWLCNFRLVVNIFDASFIRYNVVACYVMSTSDTARVNVSNRGSRPIFVITVQIITIDRFPGTTRFRGGFQVPSCPACYPDCHLIQLVIIHASVPPRRYRRNTQHCLSMCVSLLFKHIRRAQHKTTRFSLFIHACSKHENVVKYRETCILLRAISGHWIPYLPQYSKSASIYEHRVTKCANLDVKC